MTRLPADPWGVEKAEGPAYRVGPNCSVPGCTSYADHAHHLWRRSFTIGPAAYVRLGDVVYGNVAGLCYRHHADVTENRAWIKLQFGQYVYGVMHGADWHEVGPLEPQPPVLDGASSAPTSPLAAVEGRTVEDSDPPCPSCGRRKRRAMPALPARPKSRYVVMVPDDVMENGHAVLTELVAEVTDVLGRDEDTPPYYVLAEALALLIQHKHLVTA